MDNQFSAAGILVLLLLALAPVALFLYVRMGLRLRLTGGAVDGGKFVMADLLVGFVLATFFGYFAIANWPDPKTPPSPIKIDQVLPGEFFLAIIAVGVGGFLVYRGANLVDLLGLRRVAPPRAAILSVGYLLAAYPLIWFANLLSLKFLSQAVEEQQLVTLFREEARRGHFQGVATILFAGVILAPCIEEFLFRGFFYGAFKSYIGALSAGLSSAALFAVFHMNLASLPGLFVLALCLTVAYEKSGSLFVSIGMHALFNLSNLALLYFQALGYLH